MGGKADPPTTGFEDRGGASWTTRGEELRFLREVDRLSDRVEMSRLRTTPEGRPIHLVRVGHPRPDRPTGPAGRIVLFLCSQHGDERAGRETCLQWLRDLAFTKKPGLVGLLRTWTMLFVPTANPDGAVANTRRNAHGVDVNRDHLTLETVEARAAATVLRDWRPDVVLDLHEFYGASTRDQPFGGSAPVVYDDDLLYLWPRNLNVDPQIHALSKTLAVDYVGKGSEAAGFQSDEYGQYAAGDQDLVQIAGDHDEGILRNLAGLRHSVSILVESNQEPQPRNGPGEFASEAERNLRRVATQRRAVFDTLRFLRQQGDLVQLATRRAPLRAARQGARQSAPVYFGGADNDPPSEGEVQDPPPCAYRLSKRERRTVAVPLRLLGIEWRRLRRGALVPMAQPAEPLIPLLLDPRASRHAVEGTPKMRC